MAAPENDPIKTGLEADGMMLGSTVVTDAQTGQSDFTAGPSITFDTATDLLVVGQAIGFESTMADSDIAYDNYTGVTDYVLTAATDVPEPGSLGLLALGGAGLLAWRQRRAAGMSRATVAQMLDASQLGSWDTAVTATTSEDVGMLTTEILFAEPPIVKQIATSKPSSPPR